MLDFRSAQEKVFKRFKFHAIAPVPVDKLIGTAANRLRVEVMSFVDQVLGHDGVAMVAQVAQHHGVRSRGLHTNSQIVHNFDIHDIPVVQIDFGVILRPLDGSLHVFGSHCLAVVILDAFLQLELPHGVADVLIAFHQIGFGLQCVDVAAEQSGISQGVHVVAGHRVVIHRGQRRSLAHGGDNDAVLTAAVAGRLIAFVGVVAVGRLIAVVHGLLLVLAASGKQAEGHGQNQQQAQHAQFLAHFHFTSYCIFSRGNPLLNPR